MPFDFNSIASSNLATIGFPGKELTGGYAERVTDALAQAAGIDICSITVTGDGVTPVILEGSVRQADRSTDFQFFQIRDGAGGTGTIYASCIVRSLSATVYAKQRIAAFSGVKTFYWRAETPSAGNYSIYASPPMWLRATWAG